ncbi:hypothetical protein IJT17_01705 [bacterium]|nr:hypothetical protein [bacterium]
MCKPDTPSVAVVVAETDAGTKPVASYLGAQADRVREQAEAQGIAVSSDPHKVRELLGAQGEEACIPVEIYDFMSAVIDFVQDLDEAAASAGILGNPHDTEPSDDGLGDMEP